VSGQTLTEVAVEVHADMRRVKPEAEAGAKVAGEAAGEELGDGITRGADRKLRESRGKFAAGGQKAGQGFTKGFEGGFNGTFAKVAASMAARFALIGGAAAAAAPGVGQLTAALVPAAGAALALPAALLSIKAASAVTKVAVMNVGEAIAAGFGDDPKKAAKALQELSGNARTFATEVIALQKPLKQVQATISERFFLPLLDDVRPLADLYLPMLRKEAADLAGPLGGLGEQLSQTARRGLVFDTVRKVLEQTGLTVIRVRAAINPLATALATLVGDTVGELPKLASGFASIAERVAAYTTRASEQGQITSAFRAGVAVLKDFGAVLGNIGSIVVSVYQAATANGNTLLANLRELTGQAAAFFRSAQGGQALAAVFGTLGEFGTALKTSLGAVLPAIGQAVEALGPALAGLAGPASQLVVAVAPLLPILAGITAQILTALTPAIASLSKFLAENENVVKGVAIALVAFQAALAANAGVAAVQAAGGIMKWVKATTIMTNVTKVATAVQYAMGAAVRFALGPIGLIITAIGLFVAAIVYLWKNNETFRSAVIATWNAVRQAVQAVVDWFVGTAWPFLVRVGKGIGDAFVAMWEKGIRPAVQAVVAFWQNVLAPAAMWLYRNVLKPAFDGISWVVRTVMAVVQLYIKVWVTFLKNVVAPAVMWLWKNVITPAWNGVKSATQVLWRAVQALFQAWANFMRNTVGPAVMWLWKNIIQPAWNGIKSATSTLWNAVGSVLRSMVGFLKDNVVNAFRTSVAAIKAAWNALRDAARVPVAFVVNKVINPLIGGFNRVAGTFGTKKIDPIPGFAAGGMPGFAGRIPGNSGGIDDRRGSLVDRAGRFLGAIKVASGEFIVNARDTARALPLLQWINSGMKGGPVAAAQRLGRPVTEKPGDGSEGWAFAKGGLAGFFDNIWDTVTNPKKALLAPVNALLGKIPGGGALKDVLIGMTRRLAGGIADWLTGSGGGNAPGNVGKAQAFIRAQAGKPYVWASAGPGGYDCSGIVSAAWNILHGRSPYQHTFSTSSLPGKFFPKKGFGGPLTAGWAHPGQRGASANVGHMAGQFIGGMRFESTGSSGVRVGSAARSPLSFANVGHYSMGGLLPGANIARADFGSVSLRRGWNLIENATGKPEPLATPSGNVEALLRELITVTRHNPDAFAGAMQAGGRQLITASRRY
jgi:hypothetical protein